MTHSVFHIVTKDPEVKHVTCQVKEVSMKEERCKKRDKNFPGKIVIEKRTEKDSRDKPKNADEVFLKASQ